MSTHWEEDNDLQSGYEGRVLRRLARYLKPYKWHLVLVLFGVVIASLLQTAGPFIIREAIDGQIQQGTTDDLGKLVLLYVGTLLGVFILQFLQTMLVTYVGQRIMMDMRLELFQHVQKMSIAFFDRNPVGRLVTRLTNDVSTI